MNCKKLIEVAMPVKEVSAESVRDKSIRHGHISTLHLWWARRPLPVCRAVVFASLVPDPLDENCPQQFKDAVTKLLTGSIYKPYEDIPYTSSFDPMEDNLRNRLLMFIGKYSKKFIQIEKSGIGTCPPKETLDNGSLIKWENKNNESILSIARKLIFVAHNANDETNAQAANSAAATAANTNNSSANASNTSASNDSAAASAGNSFSGINRNNNTRDNTDAGNNRNSGLDPESYKTCDELLSEFDQLYSAIKSAETDLYETSNRHLQTEEVKHKEENLHNAIESFLDKMPKVYDPFAGGGAIPLEAARLGCRTYANDLNPVAHIIEKASLEFPQKYGKPITYTKEEFIKIYGEKEFENQYALKNVFGEQVNIQNRLAFDVEYYAKKLLKMTEAEIGHLYPTDENGNKPIAYIWVRVGICSNPSCKAEVPLLKQFYLVNKGGRKIFLKPTILKNKIQFSIEKGEIDIEGWANRGNLICPCCGNTTDVNTLKSQFINAESKERILCVVWENEGKKNYTLPSDRDISILQHVGNNYEKPNEMMPRNSAGGDTHGWGIVSWGQLFSARQIATINTFFKTLNNIHSYSILHGEHYFQSVITYLTLWIDRIILDNTTFGRWHVKMEKNEHPFGRQAIPFITDYPEINPFGSGTSNPLNRIEYILKVIESESTHSNFAICLTPASSENQVIKAKHFEATITDPPYFDAISYSDLSDFFYVWLKRFSIEYKTTLFATPLTPKSDECTALKYHHDNDIEKAKKHFETKLLRIFKTVESQTNGIISIMFAHQSTEAWTTLCNSILNANMNISGSWSIDTELGVRMVAMGNLALASSVTVACKPSERQGIGDSKQVKAAIELKVKREVEELYKLGFRGADLLTACFGPAVSEFGKYERVEKASGEEVTVEELLSWARDAAFNAIVSDIPTDDFTRFYIGWLNLFGFSETDHDDVRRITQIGLHLDVNELLTNHLLIRNGNKQTLATFSIRAIENKKLGESKDSYTIDLVHKAMYLLKNNNRKSLLAFISEHAQNQEDIFWRVANSLKEVLPKEMEDQKQVSELLANKDNLIKDSKNIISSLGEQGELGF